MDQPTHPTAPLETPSLERRGDAAGNNVVKRGQSAAQGRTGARTFIILLISLAFVVIAMSFLYALRSPAGPQGDGISARSQAAAAGYHAAEPSPRPTPNPNATPGEH